MAVRSTEYLKFFEQWRALDKQARAAEDEVARQLLEAIDASSEPPDVNAWNEAKKLRRQAEQALRQFIDAVDIERSHPGRHSIRAQDTNTRDGPDRDESQSTGRG